jgi:hypothetical protein
MKSASTYYRMARKIRKEQELRSSLISKTIESNGCFNQRDREIENDYIANEMMRQFLATEV